MEALSLQERATMALSHDIGYLADLAEEVKELKPVVAAMSSANGWLNGKRTNFAILACYVDAEDLEKQLEEAIYDLSLQRGTDIPITPSELHQMVVKELQRFVEFRLEFVHEFLLNSRESWTERVIEPLVGWERNGGSF